MVRCNAKKKKKSRVRSHGEQYEEIKSQAEEPRENSLLLVCVLGVVTNMMDNILPISVQKWYGLVMCVSPNPSSHFKKWTMHCVTLLQNI